MILQRTRENLGGAGCSAVDQRAKRNVRSAGASADGMEFLPALGIALQKHVPLGKELAGESHSSILEASLVQAQIENQALGAGFANLLQDGLQLRMRLLAEPFYSQVSQARTRKHGP